MFGVLLGKPGARRVRLAVIIVAATAALAGCSTSGDVTLSMERADALYGSVVDNGYKVPAVPAGVIPTNFQRQVVTTPVSLAQYKPGTIVVDTSRRYLYHLEDGGRSMRYGIGVGRAGFSWAGDATIKAKRIWPSWHPPKEMQERDPLAAEWANGMPGGLQNPLGARAMYLYQGNRDTLYRLHGTNDPRSIGKAISSGCVRLVNQDVIDLYKRVSIGTKVVVLGESSFNVDAIGAFFTSLLQV